MPANTNVASVTLGIEEGSRGNDKGMAAGDDQVVCRVY